MAGKFRVKDKSAAGQQAGAAFTPERPSQSMNPRVLALSSGVPGRARLFSLVSSWQNGCDYRQ
jgi:hypothetical protein